MNLSNLKSPRGYKKRRKRLGRGDASGHGGTSTRGHKGQKARAGGFHKLGFEGGQMPLIRRIPKRGFTNIFKKGYAVLNVGDLNDFDVKEIDHSILMERGYVGKSRDGLKILGGGDLKKALKIKANFFTPSAVKKIEAAGGKVEILEKK